VGEYVSDFLRVAVPSVMSGTGDAIGFIVLEELCDGDGRRGGGGGGASASGTGVAGGGGLGERNGRTRAVERFEFRFAIDPIVGGTIVGGAMEERGGGGNLSGVSASARPRGTIDIDDADDDDAARQCAISRDAELAAEAISGMERSMRECLLRVLALRRRRRGEDERAENMSFKLCLHVASTTKATTTARAAAAAAGGGGRDGSDVAKAAREEDDEYCPELMDALGRGDWFVPEESSCLFWYDADGRDMRKGLLRPIKDVDLPSCGMKMQLGMEVDPYL
jgi:hypothetical protein